MCARVAKGLGFPTPDPAEQLLDPDRCPALSQVGGTWPIDGGRTFGVVVDPDGDLSGLDEVRSAVSAAGMVPLVIAPNGGELADGTIVQ